MLKASIDIGSNSILLLILDIDDKNIYREIENESRVTSLGKDLDKTGVFSKKSLGDSRVALEEYSIIIKKHNINIENVIVTATEAARVATNAETFFSSIKGDLGLQVTIISGEGEAYYTALGVSYDVEGIEDNVIVMDIGGASTELIEISKEKTGIDIVRSVSLPVGSVRATDWLLESEANFEERLSKILVSDIANYKTKKIICVAGTMTSVAAMIKNVKHFNANIIHNSSFKISALGELHDRYSDKKGEEILQDFSFLGKRSATIIGGMRAVLKIFNFLEVDDFVISTYGLRYGVLFDGGLDERFIK
jgi:exopolyphosphatase/guanosine-5'-triphosphate,3'-diphosphate pyrophosphatase